MTQGALEPVEQERLTRQLGRALVKAAGEDWQRVWAQYRAAGKHVEADLVVTGADGQQRPVRPPQTAIELFGQLRGGMYRPERGTWLSATYTVEPSGGFAVDFEPDAEPAWRRVPPPIGFQDELRWFPRAEDAIPEWLKVRAGLSPTPAAGVPVVAADGPVPAGGPATPPPGTPTQGAPIPGTPAPGTPIPGTPAPGTPIPGAPSPGVPGPGAPGPAAPGPGGPRPGAPGPGGPGPGPQGPQGQPGSPRPAHGPGPQAPRHGMPPTGPMPGRPPTPPHGAPRPY
ncbi:hypothetical protein [Labedaea rhizosphaerae]|uniref:Uncharacterized protein n=1 Tax=Labedaea rhizosphaerae TaxID=598644 RepID=A0A4R6S0G1_LABRH|nr:hypothetical protein [Labedaea rhizosphaerae]TDP92075.1 hypothetical protein EV186_108288 [Labedaea rhizosphaerae]